MQCAMIEYGFVLFFIKQMEIFTDDSILFPFIFIHRDYVERSEFNVIGFGIDFDHSNQTGQSWTLIVQTYFELSDKE